MAEATRDLVEVGADPGGRGPGNNGGDGFVAAAELAAQGREVSVILMCERDACGVMPRPPRGAGISVPLFNPQAISRPALIIDALFGAGLPDGDRRGPTTVSAMNAAGVPVFAVDLPSGVNGTSGGIMGTAVKATETVTFFRKKPAHLLLPGRFHCGRVRLADIGITHGFWTRSVRRR